VEAVIKLRVVHGAMTFGSFPSQRTHGLSSEDQTQQAQPPTLQVSLVLGLHRLVGTPQSIRIRSSSLGDRVRIYGFYIE
jgi:hypothetical protein